MIEELKADFGAGPLYNQVEGDARTKHAKDYLNEKFGPVQNDLKFLEFQLQFHGMPRSSLYQYFEVY